MTKLDNVFIELLQLAERAQTDPVGVREELQKILDKDPALKAASESVFNKLNTAFQETVPSREIEEPKRKIAIVMDFDETLSVYNSFPTVAKMVLKTTPEKILARIKEETKSLREQGIHDKSAYTLVIDKVLQELIKSGNGTTPAEMAACGAALEIAQGLTGENNFFERMRLFAAEQGLELEFHMISANDERVLNGTAVAHEFKSIRGSRCTTDENGFIERQADSVDFTSKTKIVIEISKGVVDEARTDNSLVNKKMPVQVPLDQMIAVGDGETDIAFMSLVRQRGGSAIGVFNPEHPTRHTKLLQDDERTDHLLPQDFREGSDLEKAFKTEIEKIAKKVEIKEARYEKAQEEKTRAPGPALEDQTEEQIEQEAASL